MVHSGSAFAGHYYSYIKVGAWPLRSAGCPGDTHHFNMIRVALHTSLKRAWSGAAQVRKQAGQGSSNTSGHFSALLGSASYCSTPARPAS